MIEKNNKEPGDWFDLKVLYVEDDTATRELTSIILSRKVRELITAENGELGLTAYREAGPDLVITDIRMPVMDGLTMSREIKARDSNAKIIVTTAHNDTEYMVNAIETGVDYYVIKPIDMDKLISAIRKCNKLIEIGKKALRYQEERDKLIGELKAAVEAKEMLIKEVHHRVKNNLQVIESLLSLQSFQVEGNTRDLFDESRYRIQAISKIHEMLYKSSDLSSINFSEYLTGLVTSLHENYRTASSVVLKMDIPEISMDINSIIPCGLVVNELVSNSLKHAFPGGRSGEIFVGIEASGDKPLTLIVRDNGIGIPEKIDIKNTTTLGMQIIISLSGQLGGELTLNRQGGTEFRIIFKNILKK